jgi:UDP-N-acetylglucosamine 2-epimerase
MAALTNLLMSLLIGNTVCDILYHTALQKQLKKNGEKEKENKVVDVAMHPSRSVLLYAYLNRRGRT